MLQNDLRAVCDRTGDDLLRRLLQGTLHDGRLPPKSRDYLDWASTCLMRCFKNAGDRQALGLLFELNRDGFLRAIRARTGQSRLDSDDILQEVFLNILRYPRHFRAERATSFRTWGYQIVRNTALKHVKKERGLGSLDDDLRDVSPLPEDSLIRAERESTARLAYVLYLNLYLLHFGQLSTRERDVLTLVEVEQNSYKEAAQALGIPGANLKMVVFRARKKIRQRISRSLNLLGNGPDAERYERPEIFGLRNRPWLPAYRALRSVTD